MIQLQRGDVFCTAETGNLIASGIRAIEHFWDSDDEKRYSHSGFMLSETESFEALTTIRRNDFFKDYAGTQVIIARPQADGRLINNTLKELVNEYEGDLYPFWRLPLFMIPPLAHINILGKAVCSELTARYLRDIMIRVSDWKGVTPDILSGEFRHWKNYELIYEGIL